MSRISKILLLGLLVVFTLACNAIDSRVEQVEDVAKTAEAIASAIPIETLQALPSALPMETLEAMPSAMPEIGNDFDLQGEPLTEWNGVPVMPQASSGQEQDAYSYTFKYEGAVKEAQDFYNDQMGKLGWSPMISMPGDENGAMLVFQKDSQILTVTVAKVDTSIIVILTLA